MNLNQNSQNSSLSRMVEMLRAGKLFFFAGSGISYESRLPSATDILRHTAENMLPSLPEDEVARICSTVQPEIFYEIIINTTGTRDSLHLWSSLHTATQQRLGMICSPNVAHYFIVEYASKYKWPIFTTNFDSMFEATAAALNLPYKVFLPDTNPPSPEEIASGDLVICKLHGSIQDSVGQFTPESLWTTMTEISRVNTRWISYLQQCMTRGHLCFVGYSARDIDLFPYLKAFALAPDIKPVFWINKFPGDNSDQASRDCNAVRVEDMYPRQAFETAIEQFGVQMDATRPMVRRQDETDIHSRDSSNLLQSLSRELATKLTLSPAVKSLMYGFLLGRLSDFARAHHVLSHLDASASRELSERQHGELLLNCARLSHELSRYSSCRRYARQALKHCRTMTYGALEIRLQARCLLSEALRMSIPGETYFIRKTDIRLYALFVLALLHFVFTSSLNRCSMFFAGTKFSNLNTAPQHELLEHSIRLGAILQRALGSPQKGWPIIWRKLLGARWNRLHEISYRLGYAAGVANTRRFMYRLDPNAEVKTESDNIYNLMTYSTGKELSARNLADVAVTEGRFDEAKALYRDFTARAQTSGNRLNAIKGLAGIMHVNHLAGVKPLLDHGEADLFRSLTAGFEGRLWQSHFEFLKSLLEQ
jgi:SIR2-like domain